MHVILLIPLNFILIISLCGYKLWISHLKLPFFRFVVLQTHTILTFQIVNQFFHYKVTKCKRRNWTYILYGFATSYWVFWLVIQLIILCLWHFQSVCHQRFSTNLWYLKFAQFNFRVGAPPCFVQCLSKQISSLSILNLFSATLPLRPNFSLLRFVNSVGLFIFMLEH